MTYSKKFLWFPKKIYGKWYWLRTITIQTTYKLMWVGDRTTQVKSVKYFVD